MRSARNSAPALLLAAIVAVGLTAVGAGHCGTAPLDAHGAEFVRIALAFAQHAPDEVDAYFGPDSLRPPRNAARPPLSALSARAHRLLDRLAAPHAAPHDARGTHLIAQVRALAAAIDQRASGRHASFDAEARGVYGMVLDDREGAEVGETLASLERALPGEGTLAARFAAYRARFVIPPDRRRAVFTAALDACRGRTAAHWPLPSDERFAIAWQLTAPGAWHRYDGHNRSTLTLNPGAVEFIDTAIDLACHEGYPGHHAQFLLADRDPDSLAVEDTIALLRSPLSMRREGAASYAVDLAFPDDERLRVERDDLFPRAGLDPATAASYFAIRQRVRALEPAIVPILRDYRDGRLSAADAAARLESRALVSSPRALLRFVDDLGPYVLGYTVARDRVAADIAREVRAGHGDAWTVLARLLTPPSASGSDRSAPRGEPADSTP